MDLVVTGRLEECQPQPVVETTSTPGDKTLRTENGGCTNGLDGLYFYRNVATGTNTLPRFERATGASNPLAPIEHLIGSTSFADLNGDNKPDIILISIMGEKLVLLNYGNVTEPRYGLVSGASTSVLMGFAGPSARAEARRGLLEEARLLGGSYFPDAKDLIPGGNPFCRDFDHDGLIDCIIGEANGKLLYYANEGTSAQDPQLIQVTVRLEDPLNPEVFTAERLSATANSPYVNPWCGDFDSDGDYDCVVTSRIGPISYLQGITGIPTFQELVTLSNAAAKGTNPMSGVESRLSCDRTVPNNPCYNQGNENSNLNVTILSPACADLTQDGAVECFMGHTVKGTRGSAAYDYFEPPNDYYGTHMMYLINIGTRIEPSWSIEADGPPVDVNDWGYGANPTLADFDGDNLIDMVIRARFRVRFKVSVRVRVRVRVVIRLTSMTTFCLK